MAQVHIKDFSCIKKATIEVNKLNIIIGPQGSGKSVITKLIYFFQDIVPNVMRCAEDGITFAEFKKNTEKSFYIWFPPQAWGSKKFSLIFSNGNFSCVISRKRTNGSTSNEVSIKFCSWLEERYNAVHTAFFNIRKDSDTIALGLDFAANGGLERSWRVRARLRVELEKHIQGFTPYIQTFIPAGRAFFTSIGRLVAGIEHGGSLDPATLKFARLFANWRDRSGYFFSIKDARSVHEERMRTMVNLIGGTVQSKRDAEYIEMTDGRRVPFSSLSSGQQELLPIWYFLDNIITIDALREQSKQADKDKEMIYIEEPEAHLFPASQAVLLDTLIGKVLGGSGGDNRRLFMTTHSPYIMARLNVLLKAGQLSKRRKKNKEISDVIPRDSWLRVEDISVQCIKDGELISIIDEQEKLVDAQFLDSISDVISDDFTKLLDIEESI